MSEKIFEGQNNYGWGLTLNMTGKIPAINKRIFSTYQGAFEFANNINDSAIKGLVLSVIEDDDEVKNGLYRIEKIKNSKNDSNAILIKISDIKDIEIINNNINTLQNDVKNINNEISSINNEIHGIDINITKFIDEFELVTNEIKSEIEDNELVIATSLTKISDNVTNIDNRIKDVEENYLTSEDKTELSNTIAAETSARTEAIESIQEQINSLGNTYYTENEIDGFIENINNTISGVSANVNTLVGTDTGKSVREIANEELVNQLISSGATEALDTLQEIADWIQQHPEDAAAMNTAITELQGTVTGYSSENTVASAISNIQTQIDNLGDTYATDEELGDAVTELEGKISAAQNAATTKVVEGTDVNENLTIEITTAEDGSKTYTINLSNVAKADDLATVSGDVATIKSDYLTSEDKTELSDAIAAETSARTEAIESIQGQINSLGDTYYTENEIDGFIEEINNNVELFTEEIKSEIEDNELVIATAITEMEDKINTIEDILEVNTIDLNNKLNETRDIIENNEFVTANTLNDLNHKISETKDLLNTKSNVEHTHSNYSSTGHTHGTIYLSGDVTGNGSIGSGTTGINISATVKDNSHSHISENISDSISSSLDLTNDNSKLVQGKAVFQFVNNIKNEIEDTIEDNELVTATAITELEDKLSSLEENYISKTEGLTQIIESETEPSEEYRENYLWLQETDDDILLEDNTSVDIRQMYDCLVELTKLVRKHEYAFSHEMSCGSITENSTRTSLMSESTPVPPEGYGDTTPIFMTKLNKNKSIEIIKDFYLKSELLNGITNNTTGWKDLLENPDETKPYLWNYKKIIYSSENNQYDDIAPQIIGVYNKLRVIDTIINYYAINNSDQQAPEINEENWGENLPAFNETKPYLWNYLNLKYIEDEDINKPSYEGFGGANVKHLTIKSSRTEQEIRDNIINLLDNELVWCEGNNGLYIKSKGKIVKINGSSGTDDDNEIEDIMTGITFVNEGVSAIDFISTNGTKYTMKVNDNGNLKIYNNKLDTPHNPPTGDASGTEGNNVSGLFLEKLYINSLYCGGLVDNNGNEINEHSINPCSHNFVELSNLTTEDINLNGLSLQYASSGTNWKVLPLWGIIKAGSTFLIRGAQCSIMDLNTTVIKVKDYDMEWRDNDGSLIKFDNKSAKFYLTYGTSPCDTENPYILDTSSNTLKFRYGYIDLVGLSNINVNGNNIPEGQENKPYPYLNSNYLFRKYYAMDNVSQATKAKDKRNNQNDWYYIDLRRDDILPNIKDYTPRASSYGKNIFYDKSNLLDMKPTICTITFGIQATDNGNGATRCFTWVSKGYYDEYLWYRKKGETTWICNESIKNSTDDIEKYYNRICQEYTNGSVFTSHKLIIRGLEHGSYEYTCGKPSNDGSPDFEKCIEIREFVVRSNDELTNGYSFIQISDQQGFNWDEYQVWYYAAKYISENNDPHFLINTGDMTQNGNRLNEWIDYFNAKTPLNNLEEMATIGNNDLSPKTIYKLGDGGNSSKINFANINFFYTFEIDENNPSIFSHENIDYGYIPSIYSFNYGNTHFLCVNSEISEMTETNILGIENNKGLIYSLIKEWCQRDINLYSNYDWKIAYCHEMPFTIITDKVKSDFYNPNLNNGYENELNNKRAGSRINTTTKTEDEYWFSRFCQDNGIRLVMGGHKHTQAITYPIKENIKPNGKVNSMKPIIEVTYNDLNEYFDESTHLIEINDEKSELKGQKFPNKWFIEDYQGNSEGTETQLNADKKNNDCHFCTFELVESITAPIYSMSQSTGYKHTSNKELPAQKIPWCHYYYPSKKEETINGNQSIITSTVNNEQKYPFYSIYTISENNISISVKRLENILINGKFNINEQGESIKTGKTVITVKNGLSPDHLTNDKKVVINK